MTGEAYDPQVQEELIEAWEAETKPGTAMFQSMSRPGLLVFFAIAAFIIYMFSSGLEISNMYIIVALLAGAFILVSMKEDFIESDIISIEQCQTLITKYIKNAQVNIRGCPQGALYFPFGLSRLRYKNRKPWYWDVYIEVIKYGEPTRCASVRLLPTSGAIIGTCDRSEGYSGREAPHIQTIKIPMAKWDSFKGVTPSLNDQKWGDD